MLLGKYPYRFYRGATPVEKLTGRQSVALGEFRQELGQGLFSFEEASCLCGQKEGMLIAKRDRYALSVETHLCKKCGILWTSPRMTDESLRRFYERNYRAIYVGEETASAPFFADQAQHGQWILTYLADFLTYSKGTVFDVGCGAGGVLEPFRAAGFEVHGCDHGAQYLEYGRSQGLGLEHGGAEVLAKYGKADLIILSHVLEHFSHPKRELEQLSALLKDDGYIFIVVPGIYNIHNAYKDTLLYLQNAHLYHYTLNTLTTLMSSAGFELVRGNQTIDAVYKKARVRSQSPSKYEYRKILSYLIGVELSRMRIFNRLPAHVARIIGWTEKLRLSPLYGR